MSQLPIKIYTDGSSSGNPGPGGYGIVMKYGEHTKEFSKGFRKTTNNRMELLAVVDALRKITNDQIPVVVYSDSKYVIDAIEKGWVYSWRKKGFAKKKNPDLWRDYLAVSERFDVKFIWVKGHAGHLENERCDTLAVAAGQHPTAIDSNYENGING